MNVDASSRGVRRRPIGLVAGAALFAAALFAEAIADEAVRAEWPERPNIVLIMADDMGYSDLGCYGGEIQTPHLDQLAENGLRFTQFYNAGRCCPTRASLLTGLYPHQAGVGHMVSPGDEPGYRGRLTERCVTMAELLGGAGYQTFVSGKWHVTHYAYADPEPTLHPASWPLARGFDRFFGHLSGGGSYWDMVSLMKGDRFVAPGDGFYLTDAINDYAVRFIEEADADRPFLLYVAHYAPHWPLHAPEEAIARYDGVYDVGWDRIREQRYQRMIELEILSPHWPLVPRDERADAWDDAANQAWEARRMAVYAAQIDVMDQGIGRLLDALRRTGRWDNTLILFLSDNGGSDEVIQGIETRHGHFARGGTRPDVLPGGPDTYASYGVAWANASNTPFRRYKKWAHEGGIASPLIAHWPAGIRDAGALRHQVGHVKDLLATCLELAAVPYPYAYRGRDIVPLEGTSLLPALRGEPLERPAIFWEHEGHRAVRCGKWKLVAERGGPWELYDLEADRTELNDLAPRHPERVERMATMWDEWSDRALVRR